MRLDASLSQRVVTLDQGWRSRRGDDPTWAEPALDDSHWQQVPSTAELSRQHEILWFRLPLEVDEALWQQPLAMFLDLRGSAELFLNGELVAAVGTPPGGAAQAASTPGRVRSISLPSQPQQWLAVRYSPESHLGFDRMDPFWGFRMHLGGVLPVAARVERLKRAVARHQMGFVGFFVGQAILHLLLFAFYPRIRSNAYFATSTLLSALLVGLHFERVISDNLRVIDIAYRIWNPLLLIAMLVLLGFTYEVFDRPRARAFYSLVILGVVLMIVVSAVPSLDAFFDFWWFQLAVLLDMLRNALVATRRGWRGAWMILVGLGSLSLCLTWQLLLIAGIVPQPLPIFPIAYYGVGGLLFWVSVYLAFHFARMGTVLRERLALVEELSARTLEQELAAKELEVENRRKSEELEAARALQLSLLPASVPEVRDLGIAVSMHTATEVGGDFYDFHTDGPGSLIATIGDATGHGARAGAMVSMMKGLFTAFGDQTDLHRGVPRFFKDSSRRLRSMNLGNSKIAMAIARIQNGRLSFASAGMPPALIRRHNGQVDELMVAGMPLGGLTDFDYGEVETDLAPGDAVLLMSDGLPELLNADEQALGYDNARNLLAECADLEPSQVIERLNQAASAWSGGPPFPDDITFVVIERRKSAGGDSRSEASQ